MLIDNLITLIVVAAIAVVANLAWRVRATDSHEQTIRGLGGR
jgi:hypothetical protein